MLSVFHRPLNLTIGRKSHEVLLVEWSGVCHIAYLHEEDQPCRASHDFRAGRTWDSPNWAHVAYAP